MFEQIKIDINGSALLLILLAAALIAYTVWIYRTTIPPSGRLKRNALSLIRASVLVGVLFLIFEPGVARFYKERELPVIPVLIDRSKSMSVRDSLGIRGERVIQFLNQAVWKELQENNELRFFQFADSVSVNSQPFDSIRFDGWTTDIAASLEHVRNRMNGKNLAAMILITDGQYNYGANPLSFAELSDVPVHTVGAGDIYEPKDIAIVQTLTNSVAYMNAKVPMDVLLSAGGFKGKAVTVQIMKNRKIIDSKIITAPDDQAIASAQFEITADEEGMLKYEITAVPLAGEMTTLNNTKSVYIRVLKSRMKIMLISGQPGPDQSMIYQNMISNPDYRVRSLVQKSDGSFIAVSDDKTLTDDIAEYDGYIFNQYPNARSSSAFYYRLTDHIRTNQKPWMFLYGPDVDLVKYAALKTAGGIDFAVDPNIRETAVYLKLTNQGRSGGILQINESIEATDRYWTDIPPVWIQKAVAVPSAQSTVLARADMSRVPQALKIHGDIPLIVTNREKKQKSLTVGFYGFWKIFFTPLGLGKENPAYPKFFEQSIRWLTLTDDTKPVIVTTDKTVYPSGQKIVISGQAYDDQFRPVSDAVFKATIRSGVNRWAMQLNPLGNGRYETVTGSLPVGDYTLSGDAEWNGVLLGRDEKKFTVESFSAELVNTAQNRRLLERIARISGGRYLTLDQAEKLNSILKYEALLTEKKDETDLWNQPLAMFLIAAFLAAEWWIRKRSDIL